MKFTLSWLKDHLETDATLEQITDTLTAIGLEVEDIDDRSGFNPFIIARILTAQKHPDADKLQVLGVDTGDGKALQVVCGAPNARAGLVGVFAPPGAYVPGIDTTLTVGKIRGVESFGMMCSERELLLSNEHNGIIELPENAPVGTSFAAYAGLNDPVIDISLTPNRADCAGIHGIARDLAAAGLGTLKAPETPGISGAKKPAKLVKLHFGDSAPLCTGFAWRSVSGVKNRASPKWLQQRLTAVGLRPINALVDITNYLTFDQGRPLHVFDADKIKGNLTVRCAQDGEKFTALDSKEYTLTADMCVIADDSGVVSLSGIMGGEATGCDENTKNVLIESALWNAPNIAQTGRALGIVSDARYRFERGVDPAFMQAGLELATQMVTDFCGGIASKAEITGFTVPAQPSIKFPLTEIKRLTSLDVPEKEVKAILESLGFTIAGHKNTLTVTVPTWRADIEGKADLVEEVMRIYGIGTITPQPLPLPANVKDTILTPLQIRTRNARRALAARAMLEAVTLSFISEKAARLFGGGKPALKLANPIAADLSDMRPSLLPSLIIAAKRNAARGFHDLALFEVAATYEGDTPDKQRRVAGGLRRGTARLEGSGQFWAGNAAAVNVFDAKADALAVLAACGMSADKVQVEAGAPHYYHPGRSGVIKLGPKVILGHFGEFHPETLEQLDATAPLCGFEVFLDAIPESKKKSGKTRSPLILSALQQITRDFAFVVDKSVTAASIIRAANGADKKLIQSVQVFDVFEGASLGADKKSVAIEVTLQPFEHTLTDKELEALSEKIIANVIKSTGGTLRS